MCSLFLASRSLSLFTFLLLLPCLSSLANRGGEGISPLNPKQSISKAIKGVLITSQSLFLASFPLLPSASAKVRGYQAAQSAFAPNINTNVVPKLPQSVLLNTLPINNELVGELQAYLESFEQLIEPNNYQKSQIAEKSSVLWNNLRINAQRAAGMFLYNRDDLLPDISSEDTFLQQSKRRIYGEIYLAQLKESVLQLVTASRNTAVEDCIRIMKCALTSLSNVATLLVPEHLLYLNANATSAELQQKYHNVPKLIGRAMVDITFQRPGPLSILKNSENSNSNNNNNSPSNGNDGRDLAKIRLVVDGINYPYTSGNFISLCQLKFYEDTKVEIDNYETSDQSIPRYVFGSYEDGYKDPLTNVLRTVPLEVLRKEKDKRCTVVGNAFNSLVFTRAKPVKSFATVLTIALFFLFKLIRWHV